jgi:hypothetical protein
MRDTRNDYKVTLATGQGADRRVVSSVPTRRDAKAEVMLLSLFGQVGRIEEPNTWPWEGDRVIGGQS